MLTAISPRLYADLIGKPFLADARGPSAYDCLGLAIEMQRRQGHAVPDYASTPDELHRQYSEERGVLGPCYRIERATPGCVVLMRGIESERHLGTMTDRFTMLHASAISKSVVHDVLSRSIYGHRVLGYYFPEPSA